MAVVKFRDTRRLLAGVRLDALLGQMQDLCYLGAHTILRRLFTHAGTIDHINDIAAFQSLLISLTLACKLY